MGFARQDFRNFIGISGIIVIPDSQLSHSAKGTTWEEHKYIKRIDGTYYYPDSYEGGRHLPDGEGSDTKSTYGEYDKDDNDFKLLDSDKAQRIGSTDFFAVQREDGTWVIGEEDMKWVLPQGVDPTSGDFQKNLEAFEENISNLRANGADNYSNSNWLQWATEAIDKASGADVDSSGKISEEDINNLAKEVIKGNFGNGDQRKELLGDSYAEVQAKVNELMKSVGSQTVSTSSSSSSSVQEQVKAALEGVKDNRVQVAIEAWNKATKKS